MQYSLQELTDKLLRALDKDNNVVDMPGVLAVLAVLEDYPVTKDSLGQTRVGKYVNEMRRKTSDKDLSRRAKNLVRRWKQLVDGAGSGNSGSVNGEGIASKPGGGQQPPPALPPHLLQGTVSKPSSPGSRPATPSSGKSTQSPGLPSRSRPDTPGVVSRPSTPSSSVHSPGLHISRPATPAGVDSPLSRTKTDATTTTTTPAHPSVRSNQALPGRAPPGPVATTPSTPAQPPGSNLTTSDSLSKTNAANKKRRRDIDSNILPTKKLHLPGESPDGGGESKGKGPRNGLLSKVPSLGPDSPGLCDKLPGTPPAINSGRPQKTFNISNTPSMTAADKLRKAESRTPKVKTTAELIREMRLNSSEVSVKIANNQIERESDPIDVSIVPAGAKPRPRRKPGTVIPPNTSDKSLIQTKTEMMEKFLQNSYNMSGDHYERTTPSPHKSDPPSRTHSPASFDQPGFSGSAQQNNGSFNSSLGGENHIDIEDKHPITFFTDDNKIRHAGELDEYSATQMSTKPVIDPWSLLPPLLPESEIDWSEEPYEPPDITVTETEVDRLHDDRWERVNGQFGPNNEWVDWTSSFSIPTYNGDMLHILPYVDINE